MFTSKQRERLFWCLVIGFVLAGTLGCGPQEQPTVERRSVDRPSPAAATMEQTPAGYSTSTVDRSKAEAPSEGDREAGSLKPAPAAKPKASVPPRRKPARQDDYDRHPSRWKHKLKAKYA